MAISETIETLKTDITNAYDKINEKGGTIPTEKNTNNLATSIDSIQGGGSEEITVDTAYFYSQKTALYNFVKSLPKINIGSATTNLDYAFAYYEGEEINFGTIDTSNVVYLNYSFQLMVNVTELDLTKFNVSRVPYMNHTFKTCTNLKKLNLSTWELANSVSAAGLFQYCYRLEELYLDKFDFSKLNNYVYIFANCGTYNSTPTKVYVKDETAQTWILNLSTSNRPSTWTTENVIIAGSDTDTRGVD